MAKIIRYGAVIPPDPGERPAVQVTRIEVTVTPDPKTTAQRRGNAKAEQLGNAQARQAAHTPAPQKVSKWQKKARRKRKREIYRLAAKADAARDGIKQN